MNFHINSRFLPMTCVYILWNGCHKNIGNSFVWAVRGHARPVTLRLVTTRPFQRCSLLEGQILGVNNNKWMEMNNKNSHFISDHFHVNVFKHWLEFSLFPFNGLINLTGFNTMLPPLLLYFPAVLFHPTPNSTSDPDVEVKLQMWKLTGLKSTWPLWWV